MITRRAQGVMRYSLGFGSAGSPGGGPPALSVPHRVCRAEKVMRTALHRGRAADDHRAAAATHASEKKKKTNHIFRFCGPGAFAVHLLLVSAQGEQWHFSVRDVGAPNGGRAFAGLLDARLSGKRLGMGAVVTVRAAAELVEEPRPHFCADVTWVSLHPGTWMEKNGRRTIGDILSYGYTWYIHGHRS